MEFLFKNIAVETKKKYLNQINVTHKTYDRGQTIVNEGNICNSIYFINSGLVVAKNIYQDGHESIIKILSNNDSFGEALIFSNNREYKANFICEKKTSISIINYDDIFHLISLDTKISLNLLNKISNNLVRLNDHIKVLNKKTVKSKICTFLYLRYLENKQSTFTILYNKTELALFLNTERPTLSKEISLLVKDNIISNMGNTYTIINFKEIEKNI